MGLYDEIHLTEFKCPRCDYSGEVSFQTKVFDCLMDRLRIGDQVVGPWSIDFRHWDTMPCPECSKRFRDYLPCIIEVKDCVLVSVTPKLPEEWEQWKLDHPPRVFDFLGEEEG